MHLEFEKEAKRERFKKKRYLNKTELAELAKSYMNREKSLKLIQNLTKEVLK